MATRASINKIYPIFIINPVVISELPFDKFEEEFTKDFAEHPLMWLIPYTDLPLLFPNTDERQQIELHHATLLCAWNIKIMPIWRSWTLSQASNTDKYVMEGNKSRNHNSKRKEKGFCKGKVEKFMDARYVPCSHELQAFLWIPYSVNTSMKMNLWDLVLSKKTKNKLKFLGDETMRLEYLDIYRYNIWNDEKKIKCFNIDDNDLWHQARLNVVNTILHTKTSPKFWGATMKWCISPSL